MQVLPCQLTHVTERTSPLVGTLFMVCSHPLDTLILPRCMPSEEVFQAQLEFVKILASLLQSTDLNYAIFQILCSQFCPLNTRKSDGERSNQGSPQTASELGIEMAKEFTNLGV